MHKKSSWIISQLSCVNKKDIGSDWFNVLFLQVSSCIANPRAPFTGENTGVSELESHSHWPRRCLLFQNVSMYVCKYTPCVLQQYFSSDNDCYVHVEGMWFESQWSHHLSILRSFLLFLRLLEIYLKSASVHICSHILFATIV
jgi:hypothetical protein